METHRLLLRRIFAVHARLRAALSPIILGTIFVAVFCLANTVYGGEAIINTAIDPHGRVVDVTFDQDIAVTAPWDRFRFSVDWVLPQARDGGAFLADLNGDGAPDLFLATFDGEIRYFPGVLGNPQSFGEGTLLKQASTNLTNDPFDFGDLSAVWTSGDTGDIDGDGTNEIVVGNIIYRVVSTNTAHYLKPSYTLPGGSWDAAASIGDLNGDGKPDIVVTFNYGATYIFYNNSQPGAFNFTSQLLHSWGTSANNNHLTLGDLNGDGLLDLAGPAGWYANIGTRQSPNFDFSNPTPWNKSDEFSWLASSDQPPHVYLRDQDGDGLLDAYVSNLSSTIWQVLFYKNVGARSAPQFRYEGPVLVRSTPVQCYYRGDTTPNISGHRAFAGTGDINSNGNSEVCLSTDGNFGFSDSTILWHFAGLNTNPAAAFSYQDLTTFPSLSLVDRNGGVGTFGLPDPLVKPPNVFSGWFDMSGDGLSDVLVADAWFDTFNLYRVVRTNSWPFQLISGGAFFDPYLTDPIRTTPSGAQAKGRGVAAVDVDLDGRKDLVVGSEDGRLLYYRNVGTSGSAAFSDPVPLTDNLGNPLSFGTQSWPTAIDLNGDGVQDFLVANYAGLIRKVICVSPGQTNGYALAGYLATTEQDPVNVTHVSGGGAISPSIATLDVDNDGDSDVVMGDVNGRVWVLKNEGPANAPSFSLVPLSVSATSAAYLEKLNSRTVRLRFAVPLANHPAILSFFSVPTLGGEAISGTLSVAQNPVLRITSSVGKVVVSWSTNWTGYLVESSDLLEAGWSWSTEGQSPVITNNSYQITESITNEAKFFRLRHP